MRGLGQRMLDWLIGLGFAYLIIIIINARAGLLVLQSLLADFHIVSTGVKAPGVSVHGMSEFARVFVFRR